MLIFKQWLKSEFAIQIEPYEDVPKQGSIRFNRKLLINLLIKNTSSASIGRSCRRSVNQWLNLKFTLFKCVN